MQKLLLSVVSLRFVTIANAGVVIELVPTPPPFAPWSDEDRWAYGGGDYLTIQVFARLDNNGPDHIQVRSMQFDFSDTDHRYFSLYPSHAHDAPGAPFTFWDFSSTAVCQDDPNRCGYLHDIDGLLTQDDLVRIEYLFPAAHSSIQMSLFRDHAVPIGLIETVSRNEPGEFLLDLMNENDPDHSSGARITFGFGGPSDPMGEYSAYDGTITGGRVWVVDIPEPATIALLLIGIPWLRRRVSWTG